MVLSSNTYSFIILLNKQITKENQRRKRELEKKEILKSIERFKKNIDNQYENSCFKKYWPDSESYYNFLRQLAGESNIKDLEKAVKDTDNIDAFTIDSLYDA